MTREASGRSTWGRYAVHFPRFARSSVCVALPGGRRTASETDGLALLAAATFLEHGWRLRLPLITCRLAGTQPAPSNPPSSPIGWLRWFGWVSGYSHVGWANGRTGWC